MGNGKQYVKPFVKKNEPLFNITMASSGTVSGISSGTSSGVPAGTSTSGAPSVGSVSGVAAASSSGTSSGLSSGPASVGTGTTIPGTGGAPGTVL